MTIQEASDRYQIPINILKEYESWGRPRQVKFAKRVPVTREVKLPG